MENAKKFLMDKVEYLDITVGQNAYVEIQTVIYDHDDISSIISLAFWKNNHDEIVFHVHRYLYNEAKAKFNKSVRLDYNFDNFKDAYACYDLIQNLTFDLLPFTKVSENISYRYDAITVDHD